MARNYAQSLRKSENRPTGRRLNISREDQLELSKMGGHASRGGHGGKRDGWEKDYQEDRENRGLTSKPRRKLRVGFAAMDPEEQREIASRGGRHSHDNDHLHGRRQARNQRREEDEY